MKQVILIITLGHWVRFVNDEELVAAIDDFVRHCALLIQNNGGMMIALIR
ncbi:hypothetical protein [Lacticaseibacillus saniviri]|nr:hypothetical protein [Lacticaseibacillus saniviri]